ncbi:hypothetical protein Poli38472_009210 [Pythium oligandrum]|uniref:Peptide chain release factor N(5)-glutamine methyltransferase n=1 Tax=Pythium oligandrum TaxID=41045 RepID=A0A8K1CLA4_PYTOL|nr:hypothetical protein Poli38472_009210 [Pythium oligandrum]|eukprot:TMW65043.1 hypothetical protein Poli38472_009210 [Pythium oligandrum]
MEMRLRNALVRRVCARNRCVSERFGRRFHGQSVQETLAQVRERLQRSGVHGSDAKALIAHALTPKLASSNDVFLHSDRLLTAQEGEELTAFLDRRCSGEPLAYVLGYKEFWSLPFQVNRDTLIPRSDSEVLIEAVASLYPRDAPLKVLDLGAGTGCLLLSTLSEFPRATGVGVDICPNALQVASANAAALLDDSNRATFVRFDMADLPKDDTALVNNHLIQRFDVILCNPPYIPQSELPLVAPDVFAYEPHSALFSEVPQGQVSSPEDPKKDLGLRFYEYLAASVSRLLRNDGAFQGSVVLEIGSERQAHAVRDLFPPNVVSFDRFLMDAAGKYRGVVFRSAH